MIQRRSFLGAILAASCAPAFVRSGVLMPVKEIWVPPAIDPFGQRGFITVWKNVIVENEGWITNPKRPAIQRLDPYGQRGFVNATHLDRYATPSLNDQWLYHGDVSPVDLKISPVHA